MSLTLPDLIDIPNLQMLMERFLAATGIPVGIIGSDGDVLVAVGWQEICTRFHRCQPVTAERCRQSDAYIKSRLGADNYVQYKCRNGLWDLAVPIVIAGEHVATLFLGQFFYDDEEIDEAFFQAQAREFAFDAGAYMAALRKIPVFSREKVARIMEFYISFVNFLVGMGQVNCRRAETENTLRESEERYRALFESANDAIFTIRDGCIVNCNRMAIEMFRCTTEDFIGKRPDQLSPHIQTDGNASVEKAREKIESALAGIPQFFEWRHRHSDGTLFDAEVSLNRLEYRGNTELMAVIRDVTERKRAEEELQQAHDDLEKRVAARTEELAKVVEIMRKEIGERRRVEETLKAETAVRLQAMEDLRQKEQMLMQQSRQAAMGEMIGNIAHQWRQPLNTLGLMIQHLQLIHEAGEFTKEYLADSVTKSMAIIQHMSQTIDDFRNFFRPDKEKVEFNALTLIMKTISLIKEGFDNRRIRLEIGSSADPVINGYPNEYSQVLLNILINARDALLSRGIDNPRVVVDLSAEAGRSVVTVTDNAGGIPEEIMDKIFDPYFTTKGPDKGTGVGLFMSKTIIEKNMNGRLAARNTGDGAEFRIEV